MRIALLSLDAFGGGNLEEVEKLICLSVQNEAAIVLLPELSYGGYRLDKGHFGNFAYEDALTTYSTLAKRYKIAIGFGAAKLLPGGKYSNRYTVVSDVGDILAEYDKTHIFSFGGEDEFFEAGDSLATFEHRGIVFGVSICYDLRFAEIFSIYSTKCDVVLCPSAWPKKRVNHYRLLLRARAVENNMNIVGINWQGTSPDGIEYSKSSFVATGSGNFKKATFKNKELEIHELNTSRNIGINNVVDKRFSFYAQLLKNTKNNLV